MKQILIFGLLLMFAYAGFRPPEGMRKFPIANLEFRVETTEGTITATLQESLETLIIQDEEE